MMTERSGDRKEIKGQKESSRCFVVRPQRVVYGAGVFMIGMSLLFLMLELLYHIEAIPVWVYFVILAMSAGGVYVCLEAKNRKLTVENDRLCYTGAVGKGKEFGLEEIGCVKAAADFSGGRDYLRLYDKKGKIICRLECSMRNTEDLLWYLYDNKIVIDTGKNPGKLLTDLFSQRYVVKGEMGKLADQVYGEVSAVVKEWKGKNQKLGADFYYGFMQYYGNRIDADRQIQPEESRYEGNGETLPEDYLCVLELFVQKDGCFIRDKRGKLLVMQFPVFYSRSAGTEDGALGVYYSGNCIRDMKEAFRALTAYLTGHKFIKEQTELGYELKKTL